MNWKYLLIFIGILFIFLAILFGFKFQNAGCGLCGGYENRLIPKLTTSLQYIPSFSKPSQSACALMGCSAGITYPVFIDIYLGGIFLIFLGIYLKSKTCHH